MDFGFQVNSNENRSEFALLPEGTYHVEITEGDVKQSASGGTYVQFKYKVVEGPCMNRVLFDRFNIINPNPESVRIGRQQLISLADSVGINDPSNTDPFIGKHTLAKVTIEEGKGNYGDSNRIKGYKKYTGTFASAPAAPVTPTTPQQAQTGAKNLPWLNK